MPGLLNWLDGALLRDLPWWPAMRTLHVVAILAASLFTACGGDSPGVASPAPVQLRASTTTGAEVALSNLRAEYLVTAGANSVVVQDLVAGTPPETFDNPQRILFADEALAFDRDGVAGQAYRVYKAAFNRTPDIGGLSFWIERMDSGVTLEQVSGGFAGSDEFTQLYGANSSNAELVDRFYRNVLGRAPEQAGLDFWVSVLDRNAATRPQVLAGFSESAENKAGVAAAIAGGIRYISTRPSNPAQALSLLRSAVWVEDTQHGPLLLRIGITGEYLLSDPYPRDSEGQPGIEYGLLSFPATDSAGYVIEARPSIDTNGKWGLSHLGPCMRLKVVDGVLLAGDVALPGCGLADVSVLLKVAGAGGVEGAWTLDGAGIRNPLIVFLGNGKFAMADPVGDTSSPSCGGPGVEAGTYTYDAGSRMVALTSVSVNTNGCAGLAEDGLAPGAPMEFILAADGRTATLGGTTIYRVN
jgi:hypothetical protein